MAKRIKTPLLILSCLLAFVELCSGQIVVQTTPPFDNVSSLVNDILLGEGVKASNVTFSGNSSQIGFFKSAGSFIGIDSGIVMSTGKVEEIMPPQPNIPWQGTAFGSGANDGDLLKLAELVAKAYNIPQVVSTEDAAVLEFDFVPSSDSVVFRYVFASEEYPAYIDKKYNDVFGFFISGPGIDGQYSSPAAFPDSSINIAVVPGTEIPVSISSINMNRNGEYYLMNSQESTTFNFNGYTTVLTAYVKVTPCQTYHIKLAIADGTKNDIDSGVLLEAKSFSTSGLNITPEMSMVQNDDVIESCVQSRVTIKRKGKYQYSDNVYVSIHPSSQAGAADISGLPLPNDPLVIPAGEDEVVFYFTVINDAITEGKEKLVLDFHLFSNCSDIHRTFVTNIDDIPGLVFAQTAPAQIDFRCFDVDTTLDGIATGGYGQYSYSWTRDGVPLGDVTEELVVPKPSMTTVYAVSVSDACSTGPISRQFVVNPPPTISPIILDISSADTLQIPCRNQDFVLVPDAFNSFGGVSQIEWKTIDRLIGTDTSTIIHTDLSEYYYLTVTDLCGNSESDSIYVSFANATPLDIVTSGDVTICSGELITISANAVGGTGTLSYTWDNGSVFPSQMVAPDETSQYIVSVSDFCGEVATQSILVKVNEVVAEFVYEYDESDFGVLITNFSKGENLKYTWSMDREDFSDKIVPYINLEDVEDHVLELTITDTVAGCKDVASQVLLPQMFTYIPNAFTPNGDGYNDVFKVSIVDPVNFEMTIFDRWGSLVFKSTDPNIGWDGTSPTTGIIAAGTYTFFVKADRSSETRIEKYGIIRVEP